MGMCLMTNHVHLLVCPESASCLGQFMKALAPGATGYRNRLEGPLVLCGKGRYKSYRIRTIGIRTYRK